MTEVTVSVPYSFLLCQCYPVCVLVLADNWSGQTKLSKESAFYATAELLSLGTSEHGGT